MKMTSKPRGRPRNLDAKYAVLRAARELLDQEGPGAVTIEAVAERSGISKPTIYRWWPNRHAVVMDAMMERAAAGTTQTTAKPQKPQQATPLVTLKTQLHAIAEQFSSKTGRHITTLLAAADSDTELAKTFRHHFVMTRRDEGRALLNQAQAERQLGQDVDVEVALDQLYGPLFFRLLLGHAPLNAAFVERLFEQAMKGMGVVPSKKSAKHRLR